MMFPENDRPRVIGVPPGADFPKTIFENILQRCQEQPPEALARINILVPSQRMRRRLLELFQEDARLIPRVGVITDVTHLNPGADLPAPVTTLRRSLELKQLVDRMISLSETLSPAASIELTESLARLLDEMQSEGVPLSALDSIAPQNAAGHWEQSIEFLQAIRPFLDALSDGPADTEARHRASVLSLLKLWETTPPKTPVIIAGSTGSRDTTRILMETVARLPQGAIVLPGFDFHLPHAFWSSLPSEQETQEDHPQYRLAKFLQSLGLQRDDVEKWGQADERRNALISLSLNPAGDTGSWLTEGPKLGDLKRATRGLTMMVSNQPRDEAQAIALAMRHAVAEGKKVALISPDATLARRVNSALRRWQIKPDDSGGLPLQLSTAGRFLRHVGDVITGPVTPATLIPLLKHPYTYHIDRGPFQLFTQRLELFLRKKAIPAIDAEYLGLFAKEASEADQAFADWLGSMLNLAQKPVPAKLSDNLAKHTSLAEAFCTGDKLWSGTDGETVLRVITSFRAENEFAGTLTFSEYYHMLERALAAESDREQIGLDPNVTIWGTLEARVQGADVVILGSLNEGVWPEQPAPDPWLNREMRRDLGLLLPERQLGLAAHDYQQAVGAPEVILSRARRSDDSDTVPSRWLNRLTNLLEGLPETHGPEARKDMKARGDVYVASAMRMDQPTTSIPPAKRPAPAPPALVRPKTYGVTEIQRLIRDPYAIYAKRILGLKPLDPLLPEPDARLKGIVFHDILYRFFSVDADFSDRQQAHDRFRKIADEELSKVPWKTARTHWWGHLASIADQLIEDEMQRRETEVQLKREVKGTFNVPGTVFRMNGKADRIDRGRDGLVIYDYKTNVPKPKDLVHFDRQIVIEAVMAEAGTFEDIPPSTVSRLVHVGIGRTPKNRESKLEGDDKTVTVLEDLTALLTKFDQQDTGYIARRAMESVRFEGDYDHLSRFGEWDASAATTPEPME